MNTKLEELLRIGIDPATLFRLSGKELRELINNPEIELKDRYEAQAEIDRRALKRAKFKQSIRDGLAKDTENNSLTTED